MNRLSAFAWLFTGTSAGLLIFVNLLFVFNGFYFTGDTIFYTNYSFSSSPGNILPVFIKESELWPPLTSIIFNLLHMLPVSIMSQHKLYVFFVAISTIIATFLVCSKLTTKKIEVVTITSLCLFSSLQALLFRSAIAEPLFVFLWMIAVYCLFNFLVSKKSFFLFLFILFASLVPLARYTGVGVLFGFYALLVIFYFFKFKSQKYSFYILVSAVLLSFVPIGLYLFKNLITSGVIGRSGEIQSIQASPFFSS